MVKNIFVLSYYNTELKALLDKKDKSLFGLKRINTLIRVFEVLLKSALQYLITKLKCRLNRIKNTKSLFGLKGINTLGRVFENLRMNKIC